MKRKHFVFGFLALGTGTPAFAQCTFSTVASFNGTNGSGPQGVLVDAAGNLFGTTVHGGAAPFTTSGTVFEVATGTNTITTVTSFTDTLLGENPEAGLTVDSNGNFYGTTFSAVFEVTARTHTASALAQFNGTNGVGTMGSLLVDTAGNLYGTAYDGGLGYTGNSNSGYGTVFEVAAGSGTVTTLVAFNGTNGWHPHAALIADSAGNLYGTTQAGGASGGGTVFEVAAGSHALTTLATFNATNGIGWGPQGTLVSDAAGNLFGMTGQGGTTGDGTVFEVAAGTHALTTLVSFNGTNGSFPKGGMIFDQAGNLYGITLNGGIGYDGLYSGDGTVFEIPAGTNAISTLFAFNAANGSRHPGPELIADAAGNLYGVAFGGANNDGMVFELSGSGFVVPEPASLSLLGLGCLGLLSRRRRHGQSR